jgi:hypothetical protein
MVDHSRPRITQGFTDITPFTLGPAVRERNLAGALSRVEDTSGGGTGDRFGIKVVGHAGVPVRYGGTDIAESILMHYP